jgi:hypothetical protein
MSWRPPLLTNETTVQQPPDDDVIKKKVQMLRMRNEWVKRRLDLVAQCAVDPDLAVAVYLQCKESPRFWFDHFAITYDPREPSDSQWMPMILFEYQVDLLDWVVGHIDSTIGTIEKKLLGVAKSRDLGWSWLMCDLNVWYLIFRQANVLVGSRKEEETDRKGDLDTPFEKMREQIRSLPPWMHSINLDTNLGERLIKNPDGGQIVGEAACPSFGRGGRHTYAFMDEYQEWPFAEESFRAVSQSTNCVIVGGTPNGPHAHYAKVIQGKTVEKAEVKKIHWSGHPIKGHGLTRDENGELTSPWYEKQKERMSPEAVAAELDIKFDTSTGALVFKDFLKQHQVSKLKPVPDIPIIRAWDPGRNAFCVMFTQVDNNNRVLVLKELLFEDARIHDVAQNVIKTSNELFRGFQFEDCGDPAGAHRANSGQADPEYLTLLEHYEIDVDYWFMQDMPPFLRVKNRLTAIHNKLREVCPQTQTMSLLVDKDQCPLLVEALTEGYRYKIDRRTKKPLEIIDEVHPFEDVVDCLGYSILFKLGVTTAATASPKVVSIERSSGRWPGLLRRRAGRSGY